MNNSEFLDWLMEVIMYGKLSGRREFNCGGGRTIINGETIELSICSNGEDIFRIKVEKEKE